MPYTTNADLPPAVSKHLPEHAQNIFRKAFNRALDEYGTEEQAFKVACPTFRLHCIIRRDPALHFGATSRLSASRDGGWSAVKKEYEKGEDGEWVRKD